MDWGTAKWSGYDWRQEDALFGVQSPPVHSLSPPYKAPALGKDTVRGGGGLKS